VRGRSIGRAGRAQHPRGHGWQNRGVGRPVGRISMLFTDIEGSTRLLRELGDDYARVVSEHHRIVRGAIERHDGLEIGTEGDSFFVVFADATAAVAAAIDVQRGLAANSWPADAAVRVRMGIETGEAVPHEGTYVGLDVHRAARIAGAAHGGQILIGAATHDEVARGLPPDVRVRDLGKHRLKDFPAPEHLFQVVGAGFADVTTPIKSLGAPTSLPPLPAPLIGRDSELETLRGRLASGTRLLTLTGLGGVGKTSLALALASSVEADYADGVYFAGLEEARDVAGAWDAVMRALGISSDDAADDAVADHLASHHTLLVLDNLEQIVDVAAVVHALLKRTGATVIATSRGPLRLRAEHEFAVAPLRVPGLDAQQGELASSPAVALFVREAQRVRPSFALTPANEAHVVAICNRLEGLPLAIELAAVQVRLLAPEALLKSLDQRITLASRDHDRPGRQRTLAATIGWSVDLLSSADRASFARLGVFSGGADLSAVTAVLAGTEASGDALGVVERLADVSLITIGEGVAGEPRIAMLGVVRDVACAAREDPELDDVRRRHAEYYVELAEEAEPRLRGAEQLFWSDRLAAEQDNFRDAFEWAMTSPTPDARALSVRLATALGWYWYTHGRASEGRARIQLAIGEGTQLEPTTWANALHALGVLEQQQGENERAVTAFEASLRVWRSLSDDTGIARELNSLGVARWATGACDDARALLQESAAVARASGNSSRVAAAVANLGIVDLSTGAPEHAIDEFEEALAIDRRVGDPWAIAVDQINLIAALACAGRSEGAHRLLIDTVPAVLRQGDTDVLASTFEAAAIVAVALGDHERAVLLLGGADALRRTAEIPRTPLDDVFLKRNMEPAISALGADAYDAAWTRGTHMAVDALVACAAPTSVSSAAFSATSNAPTTSQAPLQNAASPDSRNGR
jgi:predicted ATPase/class 3 adenylate cyclase